MTAHRLSVVLVTFGFAVAACPAAADTTLRVAPGLVGFVADGKCSLNEAVAFGGGDPAPDCSRVRRSGTTTIVVPAGCYRIAARLGLGDTTVIQGAGPGPASCSGGGTVISQTATDWVIWNEPGSASTASGVTLTGGRAGGPCPVSCDGGAILNSATLALSNVLITGNSARDAVVGGDAGRGGAIFNQAGANLNVTDSTIAGNTAGQGVPGSGFSDGGAGADGGAIYNAGGHVSLVRALVSGNSGGDGGDGAMSAAVGTHGGFGGEGGAIYNGDGSTMTIDGSTISGNRAGDGGAGGKGNTGGDAGFGGVGGGIVNRGQLNVDDSTVSDNTAGAGGSGGVGADGPGGDGGLGGSGGGIWSAGNPVAITNASVAGNSAGSGGSAGVGIPNGTARIGGLGGGIDAESGLVLRNATIAGNSAVAEGGIVVENFATVSEAASVVASNSPQNNCGGPIADGGHNLVFGDKTCPGINADPKLGSLRDNGGPAPTLALGSGSAAIDLVPPGTDCPQTDERGVARPHGAACDAGAYEVAPPLVEDAGGVARSASTATISADIGANLQDTRVVVRYGTTNAYGSTTAPQDVGSAAVNSPVSVPLSGLAAKTTYHAQVLATNGDGATSSSDVTFTTPASGGGGQVPPVLSRIRQSATRWLEGRLRARISARRRLPVGTTFRFELNEPATVTFSFTQSAAGRIVRGRCVAVTKRDARRRRCRRTVVRGTLSFAAHRGANTVRFQGVLARGRHLKPGTYTLAIAAALAGARRSAPSRLRFTIVARGR
jgi:hypothetical protein